MESRTTETSSPSAPDVSVIIPVFNDEKRLAGCLAALKSQDYAGPVQIIVVDNGSTELPRVPADVTLLQESNPGSYNARNRGLEAATGSILAFTDSDCVPEPQWLSAGVNVLLSDEEIGFVGGKVQLFTTGEKPSVPELLELAVAFPQENYVKKGKFAATANMLTRRSVMEKVGNFNGTLKSGGDKEWGERVAAAGYRLAYSEQACVLHPTRSDHREVMGKMRRTTGGARDRDPSWPEAMRFVLRAVRPRRSLTLAALKLDKVPLRRRLLVTAYGHYVSWSSAFYRLKLQLTSTESRR